MRFYGSGCLYRYIYRIGKFYSGFIKDLHIKPKDEQQAETAEQLYGIFREKGIDVLLDDRDERPGVKFKDADLLGIPVRITVGRGVVDGLVEHKLRKETEKTEIPVREALEKTIEFILEERGKI